MQTKISDKIRHAGKVLIYSKAVEKVGFARVEKVIGGATANKFELAKDAMQRRQPDSIVADFLSDAQTCGEIYCYIGQDEIDIYEVLKSIK